MTQIVLVLPPVCLTTRSFRSLARAAVLAGTQNECAGGRVAEKCSVKARSPPEASICRFRSSESDLGQAPSGLAEILIGAEERVRSV